MKYKVGDKVVLTKDVDKLTSLYIPDYDAKEIVGKEYAIINITSERMEINTGIDVNKNYIISEGCIESAGGSKAFLFSYHVDSSSEQIIVMAEGQKEANEKFYQWICKTYEFKKISVDCEELNALY